MAIPDSFDLPGDEEEILCRAVEEIERIYYEAEHRAAKALAPPQPAAAPPPFRQRQSAAAPPPFREKQCVCGRGPCDVAWKWKEGELGGWAYICSAPPKCSNSVWCEDSDRHPNSQPAFWSHPEPKNRVNVTPQGACATTPVYVSPQVAGPTAGVNVNLEGAKYNGEWPICMCTAGKCKILTVKGVDYYVCPIPKGQGACSHRELVNAFAEEPQQTGNSNSRESKHLGCNPVEKEALVIVGRNNDNRPVNPGEPERVELPVDIDNDDVVPTIRSIVNTAVEEPPQTRNISHENLKDNPVQTEADGQNSFILKDNNDNRPVNPDEPRKVEFDIADGVAVPTIWSTVNTAAEEPLQTRNSSPREGENLEYNTVQKEANGHSLVLVWDNNDSRPANPDEAQKVESPFDIVDGGGASTGHLAPAYPTPIAAVAQGSPGILHQLVVMVKLETPAKSPVPAKCAVCATPPRLNGCSQCGEGRGHRNCTKASRFQSGDTGRWKRVLSNIRRSISSWFCAKGNKK